MTTLAQDLGGVVLLPCPFCGSDVIHHFEHSEGHESYGLQCTRCWTTGPQFGNKLDAITAWNTRPALLRDAGDGDSARLDWLCSGDLKMVEESPARCFRVYRDIAPPENPHAQWHAFTEAVFPSARAAIDAAMHAPGGAGGG